MASLTEKTEILEVQEANHRTGVTYSSTGFAASTVTIAYGRWLAMHRPAKIVVTITPSDITPEPVCTCGPGKEQVTRILGREPHFAGCPRWGWSAT